MPKMEKVILSIGEISTSKQRVDIHTKMTCFGKTILEQSYSGLGLQPTSSSVNDLELDQVKQSKQEFLSA